MAGIAGWNALQARVAAQLAPATLELFRDLPASHARAIARLVGDGKKLRAAVVVAVCEALGGSAERALPCAAAIECVHAASLIHDDIVDGDLTRRGRAATWTVEGARRALLLADLMFATALRRSAEASRLQVVALARAIERLAEGAYDEPLDIREVDPARAAERYDRTIGLKTGALFAAAAELGAIAAAAPARCRRAAHAFGACIGEAFQIADDRADLVLRDTATAQTRAARAMLLPRFDGTVPRDFDAQRVVGAMEADIERRISLARAALAPLPPGAQSALWRLPEAIMGACAPLGDAQPSPATPAMASPP